MCIHLETHVPMHRVARTSGSIPGSRQRTHVNMHIWTCTYLSNCYCYGYGYCCGFGCGYGYGYFAWAYVYARTCC